LTRTIIARVDKKGQVQLETKGFKGKACTETVERVLRNVKALGVDASTDKIDKTPEYYQQGVEQTTRVGS
jgi:hypothetical protein